MIWGKTGTIPVLTVFTISHKNTNDEYTTMKINSSPIITGAMKKTKHSQEKGTKVKKNMTLFFSEGLAFEPSQLCGEIGELLDNGPQFFYTGAAIGWKKFEGLLKNDIA